MIDRIPAPILHLLLPLLAVVLGWLASDALPWLNGKWPAYSLIWIAVQTVALALTPLTRQYGVGARGDH